jgi:hypothetical protein
MFRTALAATAALMISACAAPGDSAYQSASADGRDCFPTQSINGFTVVDEHHVRVRVGANRYYLLTLDWNAHNLDWDQRVALRTDRGFICTGGGAADVEVVSSDRTYAVVGVEATTPPA